MAKIAVGSKSISPPRVPGARAGRPSSRLLARGDGWSVSDVICTAGPGERPFEEQHSDVCIAMVVQGSFQYESSGGRELMTPGALILGNAGQYFECGHEHGTGDRCISFAYEPGYFEDLASEAGARSRNARFSLLRIPPVRELSRLVAGACAAVGRYNFWAPEPEQDKHFVSAQSRETALRSAGCPDVGAARWEEIGLELAGRALEIASVGTPNQRSLPAAESRVTRIVRRIESRLEMEHRLGPLAQEAKLSRYHFLRVFRQLTGLTPHRYILRARLRRAASRLLLGPAQVLDIALDSGFGDVSNFNHAFRAEFGVSPRFYRKSVRS